MSLAPQGLHPAQAAAFWAMLNHVSPGFNPAFLSRGFAPNGQQPPYHSGVPSQPPPPPPPGTPQPPYQSPYPQGGRAPAPAGSATARPRASGNGAGPHARPRPFRF